MSYERTISFSGDREKIFNLVKETFLPLNFQVKTVSRNLVELKSPGMNWIQGANPFHCISRITITFDKNEVFIKAELGGLKKNIVLLLAFLLFIVTLFWITNGFSENSNNTQTHFWLILPAFAMISIIVMKRRATGVLNALSENMRRS